MFCSTSFKVCVATLAITALCACASTAPAAETAAQQSEMNLPPKPDADTIAAVQNASALEQANFWNEQYNIHPTDLDIALAYTHALAEIKSYDRAAEVAKLTSISFPDNPDVFMLLGKVLYKNDQHVDAARAYGRAIELSPYDAAPLAALGGVFDSKGDHVTAQMAYQRALALDPDRSVTLSNLGMSLALVGELEQAEEALEKAAGLPDATSTVRQNYALILGLLGKFDKAREIASIDAPDGVAERNTEFLKAMVGENPQLQIIAQKAAQAPAKEAAAPAPAAEIPASAPTRTIVASALNAPEEQDALTPSTDQEQATLTASSKGALRTRNRATSGGN